MTGLILRGYFSVLGTPAHGADDTDGARSSLLFCIHFEENTKMKFAKQVSYPVLALLLVSVLGCAGSPTKESTGEYVDDTWITTKVKAALIDNSVTKAAEINVETFKGTVQLSGFVESEDAIAQAVSLAENIQGVKSVKNDMHVK